MLGHPACWAPSPQCGIVKGLLMHRLRTCAARLRPLTAAQAAQTFGQQRPAPTTGGTRTFQPLRCYTTPVASEPFLNGTSSNYVEEMYYAWLENPKSVHKVRICSGLLDSGFLLEVHRRAAQTKTLTLQSFQTHSAIIQVIGS